MCEPQPGFIEAQLQFRRNAIALFQQLVDTRGFAGSYNSVKRFAAKLRSLKPGQPTAQWVGE